MMALDHAAARISNYSAIKGLGLKANLACSLRIMWTISMPDRVALAATWPFEAEHWPHAALDPPMVLLMGPSRSTPVQCQG